MSKPKTDSPPTSGADYAQHLHIYGEQMISIDDAEDLIAEAFEAGRGAPPTASSASTGSAVGPVVPLFVSIKEAAHLTDCSEQLIRDLIAKGDLPAAPHRDGAWWRSWCLAYPA